MWRVAALSACLVCVGVAGVWARELDPGACGARFDVQRDKIIRTEESREMGARYLSELDVGSRAECRRLCCETDTCTVFVYEEKSPGSCYLFDCGPPEDFRCKFTAHGNFSSGVLAISRRLAELQDQERLAAALRPPSAASTPATAPSTTTTTARAPTPPTRPAVTAPPPVPVFPRPQIHTHTTPQAQTAGGGGGGGGGGGSGRCSRYQWECHSGDECIAVYNACDGVPQCADGSDEAPELGCPAAVAPVAPVPSPRPAPPPAPKQHTHPHPPVYPLQMYDGEAAEAAAEAVAAVSGGGERWPHRLLQAQPRRYPNSEVGSGSAVGAGGVGGSGGPGPHIFSHAGGLVQEGPPPAFEPPPPQPWPRRPASWGSHQGVENSGWGGWGHEWADERRGWAPAPLAPVPPPRDRDPEETNVYGYPPVPAQTMPELPLAFPPQPQRSLHDAPKKGPALPAPSPPLPPAHPTPPRPPDNNTTKKKPAAAAHVEPKKQPSAVVAPASSAAAASPAARAGAVVAGAEAEADDHDGLSERPPAGFILLTLGVLMTGFLGVYATSRARSRRRLRPRRRPPGTDPDYLVNGMYL